ncbi:hypothetical protein [Mycobacterium malmoense]|uniref:hypothetical protein n=1 Tax=Mycobacterium malmoense TaxID=1780 RepID=UPI001132896B|nr:hypothetical protein [Mycobacterium malmoense]
MTHTIPDSLLNERTKRRVSAPVHLYAETVDVLVDAEPPAGLEPVIALQFQPKSGGPIITPLSYECAKRTAYLVLQTLLAVAPQMLLGE